MEVLIFEDNATSLSRNVENRLYSEAASYPGKTDSSATPLQEPEKVTPARSSPNPRHYTD
jgi:hypothetical protein